jgi:hypothetical protein
VHGWLERVSTSSEALDGAAAKLSVERDMGKPDLLRGASRSSASVKRNPLYFIFNFYTNSQI